MNVTGDLRASLQDITDRYVGFLVGQQIPKIIALRTIYPHSILISDKVRLGYPRTFAFNCHAFTFGLSKMEECWAAREDLCPNGAFVLAHLLPMMEQHTEGNIAVYFDGDRVTHSGRINNGTVISKWGTAHTWQHGVWEVPTSYGSRVECYLAPAADWLKKTYLNGL